MSPNLFVIKTLLTLQVFMPFAEQLSGSFSIKLGVDCVIHHEMAPCTSDRFPSQRAFLTSCAEAPGRRGRMCDPDSSKWLPMKRTVGNGPCKFASNLTAIPLFQRRIHSENYLT